MAKPGVSSYIPGLDGLRAIAFLLVFWAHALPGMSFFIPATLGVTIFFFLSGYLITTLLRKEVQRTGTISLRDFYIRRTLRIFIPLYVVYALSAATAHFVLHESMGTWLGFWSVLLYFYNYTIAVGSTHAWVPTGLNVVWSLAVEEHFYILFPLLYLYLTRRVSTVKKQTNLLIAFCVLELVWRFALIFVFHQSSLWTYVATDARLDSILWGCILALRNNPVYGDGSVLPGRHQALVFGAAVLALVATLVPRSYVYRETFRYTLQALALYVIFSFVIPNIRHWSVRWLEWTPLRYIGWTSYVLYLSHDFFLHPAMTRLFPHSLLASSVITFAATLLFATGMRYALELPLQRLRARFRHVPERDPGAADGHGLVS